MALAYSSVVGHGVGGGLDAERFEVGAAGRHVQVGASTSHGARVGDTVRIEVSSPQDPALLPSPMQHEMAFRFPGEPGKVMRVSSNKAFEATMTTSPDAGTNTVTIPAQGQAVVLPPAQFVAMTFACIDPNTNGRFILARVGREAPGAQA